MGNGGPGAVEGAGDARLGTVIDGKYTIVGLLGRGGMGAVYEARHARLARRFAIKFLLPEFAADPEVLRRFENEARAAGGLEHPNLAAVTDFGQAADGAPYLVMEFLQGQDCSKLLRASGPLPIGRAANLVAQACRGLVVAHKAGIVHRDLKPENLFLTDAGDGTDLVKVLDFGIAKLSHPDSSLVTGKGATFGTAHYMSPEQVRGAGEVDERADVWALGVVLYELLSGRKPYDGEKFVNVIHQILYAEPTPLAAVRPGLPAKLMVVVDHALKKNVSERLPSVAALAELLLPFSGVTGSGPALPATLKLRTTPTPPTGPAGDVPDAARGEGEFSAADQSGVRRRLWWAAGIGVVLVAAAATIFATRPASDGRTPASPPPEKVASPAAAPAPPPRAAEVPAAPPAVPAPPPGRAEVNEPAPATRPAPAAPTAAVRRRRAEVARRPLAAPASEPASPPPPPVQPAAPPAVEKKPRKAMVF
jgi:serine/threonine-protein kinase